MTQRQLMGLILTLFVVLVDPSLGLTQSVEVVESQAQALHSDGNYEAALEKFYQAREGYALAQDDTNYVFTYWMVLDCLHKRFEFRKLRQEFEALRQEIPVLETKLPQDVWHRNAMVLEMFEYLVYREQGELAVALEVLNTSLDSLKSVPDSLLLEDNLIRRFKVNTFLAEVFLDQGSYQLARARANDAVLIGSQFKESLVADGLALAPHYVLANVYMYSDAYNKAIEELNLIIGLLPMVEDRKAERAIKAYSTMIRLHLANGNPDSAHVYLVKLEKTDVARQHSVAISQVTGKYYVETRDFEMARTIFEQTRRELTRISGPNSQSVALLDLELGDIALELGNSEVALEHFDLALVVFSEGPRSEKARTDLTVDQLYDNSAIVRALLGKSKALTAQYRLSAVDQTLFEAWRTIQLGVQFVDRMRAQYQSAEDRAILIEHSYRVFEHAIFLCSIYGEIADNQSWADSALVLMEQCKALNLRDAITHQNARLLSGIPDSLLQFETALRAEISGVKKLIRDGEGSQQVRRLISRLDTIESQYVQLLHTFEELYPKYLELQNVSNLSSLSVIRPYIMPDETLLEYFFGVETVYLLKYNSNGSELLSLGSSGSISSLAAEFRKGIDERLNDEAGNAENTRFLNVCSALFDKIVAPAGSLTSKVIIVPDGALNFVSFAALLTASPDQFYDFRAQPYFIRDVDLFYGYSSGLLAQLRSQNSKTKSHSFVFAPQISHESGFEPLEYSALEAREVASQTNGLLVEGENCTVSACRALLVDLREGHIVHFATHGYADISNGADSYLQFAGTGDTSRLYAHELTGMSLDAELVFLSACQTGNGSFQRGEGVISLARAFFQAGSKNLITTQWSISDHIARNLTKSIYGGLMKGERIDCAVAMAQRTYLDNLDSENRYHAHPAYWSALVPIGTAYSVVPSRGIWWWSLGITLAVSTLLILFFRKKLLDR